MEYLLTVNYNQSEPEKIRVEKHNNYNKVMVRAEIYINQKSVDSIKIEKINTD